MSGSYYPSEKIELQCDEISTFLWQNVTLDFRNTGNQIPFVLGGMKTTFKVRNRGRQHFRKTKSSSKITNYNYYDDDYYYYYYKNKIIFPKTFCEFVWQLTDHNRKNCGSLHKYTFKEHRNIRATHEIK